jgi:hypothetical protein
MSSLGYCLVVFVLQHSIVISSGYQKKCHDFLTGGVAKGVLTSASRGSTS